MQPGQNLISNSENSEKTKTRSISFDPFAGRDPSFKTDSSFLKSARDLVTNTAFNVADSVLFGAPGAYLNSNIEQGTRDFYGRSSARSYGDTFDALGIKPFEELSGAGKFGYGTGQAIGFFLPFGALSKASKFVQRAAFGNINKIVDMSVDSGLTGLSTGSAMRNALSGTIKGSLKGKLDNLGNTVKSANPRDVEVFKTNMNQNLKRSIGEFFQKEGQRVDVRQIEAAAGRITNSLVKNASPVKDATGKLTSAGHIDNIEDLIASAGIRVGDNRVTRNLAGYVGRAVDQSVNFYMYDNLTRAARYASGDGTEVNGEDINFNQLQIAKDSAFFASILQVADFIPGGRKAGMAQDLMRFARTSLNRSRRSFKELYESGKMNEKQLRSTASFFSKFGSGPKGNNARNLQANRMDADQLVKWLDDTYSKNKKDLLSAIVKDGGKSMVGSLPRAVVDGAATMVYMNGQDDFISPLADESMLADFLVGGFMAMRAYSPIDPRGKNLMGRDGLRWRYNTSIDAKFNLMENMGMDVSNIQNQFNAMNTLARDIDFESRNYENSEKAMGLYNLVFNNNDKEDFKIDPDNVEASSDNMKEKAIADSLMKVLSPIMLKKKSEETGKDITTEDVDDMYEDGIMPNVYNMSKEQFERFWDKIKAYEVKEGKTVDSYSEKGFDFLLEDLNDGIVKNHEDVLLRSISKFAKDFGIHDGDNLQEENGRLILKDYSFDSTQASDEVMFFHQRIKELEELGRVVIQKGEDKDITADINSKEGKQKVSEVSETLKTESSQFLDSAFEFSNYENPTANLVSNHAYLKSKNRITDALMNRSRPDDEKFNEIRRRINDVLGDTMGRNGIEITGKNEDSFNESDRDEAAEDLINKLTDLKRAAGKSNDNVESKKVHIDDVRGLFDFLTNEKIIGTKDKKIESIAGMTYDSFNKAIKDNIIMTSGLDTRDYVVYSVLAQNFGTTAEGKIKLPTRELAEQILQNQQIQSRYANDNFAIIAGEKSSKDIEENLKRYQEIVSRLSRTGKIEFVDTMEFDVNVSRDFEDTVNMADKINLVHQIYDEQLSAETYDLSDKYDKANKKVSQSRAKMISIKNKYDKLLEKESNGEKIDKDDLESLTSEYKESLSVLRQSLNDINALDGKENLFTPINKIIEEQDKVSSREFLSRLFSADIVKSTRDLEDFSLEVAQLANLSSSRAGFSAANVAIRKEIIRKSEELGLGFSRTDIEGNSLEKVIEDFVIAKDTGEFPEGENPTSMMKKIVSSVNKSLNSLKSKDEADFNSKLNASDLLDFFNKSPVAKSQENSQSFLNRMKGLGLGQFLDIDNKKLSDSFIQRIQDNDRVVEAIKEVDEAVKAVTGNKYKDFKESLHKELISVIQSYGVRQEPQKSLSIQANTLVYDDSRVGVETPLNRFNKSMRKNGIDLITIKDTYIDENGKKKTLSSTDDPQSVLNAITAGSYTQASRNDITSKNADVNKFLEQEKLGDNRVLVVLQASEDIGVTFDRTKANVRKLIDIFENFRIEMDKEAKTPEQRRMLRKHFDAITMDLNRDSLKDGNIKNATNNAIAAAIRAMYYRNNISKDLFWRMIGEDETSSLKEQSKSFKYIHHVNSKNAVGYDENTIRNVAKAIETLDTFSYNEAQMARKELVRRAQNGLRIMVLEDEIEGPDGKIMKNLSAEQVMEDTIRKIIKENNLNYTDQQINKIVEDSIYDADRKVESGKQGLFDGVVFARKEAMVADAFMMAESFEEGTTAMKAQFHSNPEDNDGISLIGKMAVRYTKSMQDFMKDAEIDYFIPSSSAKSWDNKKNIDTFNKNYDTSKSVGENLSKNINGKKVNANSVKTFSTNTLKYMFPAHHRGHEGNTNTSVTHHMTPEAIKDYNKSLGIEALAQEFKKNANMEHASGIIALFKKTWEDNMDDYSSISSAEQLYEFGLTVQDSLIRSTIFRAAKDQLMNNIMSKKSSKVSNNFLFSNSALKSPTYGKTTTDPHVKSFGETRLQHNLRNVSLSDNLTLIFTDTSENDYQDITYNSKDGKLRLNSYDRNDVREKRLKKLKKDLNTVWKAVRNSSGDEATFGSAYDFLTIVNEKLKKGFGKGLSRDVSKALENLKKEGISDFSISVNLHKIPKKFASDSIINRVEGFLDREEGNVTEVNNYEIATNHQADQDGDKITIYLDMPYSVINSSANNMEIAREPLTIPPNEASFPNVFDSLTDSKEWKKRENKPSVSSKNPIKYLSEERKSKFIVGSTVKLQGVTTLMNIAGMKYNGQPIMKFGNEEGANKDEIRDFQRQFGAITQSILDAWKGVHSDILNNENIKNYILFGQPIGDIPELSGRNAFKGIFKIPVDKDGNEISGYEREVFKEYIKESVKVFEETYSALGDNFEGGVSVKPEFFHLKRIHSNLNSLMNNDSTFIYRRLEARIKNDSRLNNNKKNDKLKILEKLFTTTEGNKTTVDSKISFSKKMEHVVNTHPQTMALDQIVNNVGDVMIPKDDRTKANSIQSKIFGLPEPGSSGNQDILYDSDSIYVNDTEFDRTIFNEYKENFGKDGKKEQLNLINAARNYGLFREAIETYIERLKKELFYYERIGDGDRASDIRRNIAHLEQKNKEKKRQIESIIKDDDTFVAKLGKKKKGERVTNNLPKQGKGKMRHYYTVKDGEYEYAFTLPVGATAYIQKQGDYIALMNPIEVRSFKSRQWKEGYAQEFATADMTKPLEELFGGMQDMKNFLINKYRSQIEAAKFRLRENMSFVMDEINSSKLFQNDLYADKANTSDFEIKTLIESIRNDLIKQIGQTEKSVTVGELNNIAEFTMKMLLSPRLIPGDVQKDGNRYLNNYKVDNQFTKSIMSFLQKNRDGDFEDFYIAFSDIMKNRSKKMLTMSGFALEGAHSTTFHDIGERYERSVVDRKNKGMDYFYSIMKFSKNPFISQHITHGKQRPSTEKDTIVYQNKEQKRNNSSCTI